MFKMHVFYKAEDSGKGGGKQTTPTDPAITNNQPEQTAAEKAAALLAEAAGGEGPNTPAPAPLFALSDAARKRMQDSGGNRFRGLFEGVYFQVSTSDRIYDNESQKTASKRLADVVLMIDGGFAAVPGSIYAVYNQRTKKTVAEFSFVGRQQQTAIKATDAKAKQELDELRGWIVDEFLSWYSSSGVAEAKSGTKRPNQREIDGSALGFSEAAQQ